MAGLFVMERIQPMIYHQTTIRTQMHQKGIKAVLLKLWWPDLQGECEKKCKSNSCCNKRILQPDVTEQNSLVQEMFKAAGHLSRFLPKFHCELNPIEYFWGMVKKYLRDHYSFDGLKENLLKALESVPEYTSKQFTSHRCVSESIMALGITAHTSYDLQLHDKQENVTMGSSHPCTHTQEGQCQW